MGRPSGSKNKVFCQATMDRAVRARFLCETTGAAPAATVRAVLAQDGMKGRSNEVRLLRFMQRFRMTDEETAAIVRRKEHDRRLAGLVRVDGETMELHRALEMLRAGPVKGDVDLRGSGVVALPAGTAVGGTLDLRQCRDLQELPEGLVVGFEGDCHGSLLLSYNPIRELPRGLEVDADLVMVHCHGIEEIPSAKIGLGMRVTSLHSLRCIDDANDGFSSLELIDCPELVRLPRRMLVHREMKVSYCGSLHQLAEHLEVMGSLKVSCCQSLATLADCLWVPRGMIEVSNVKGLSFDARKSWMDTDEDLRWRYAVASRFENYNMQGTWSWEYWATICDLFSEMPMPQPIFCPDHVPGRN